MMLRAFGGGELSGDKLVRFAYLDESGIGDSKTEPFVVVAGVIVHADNQIKAIERTLSDLADEYVYPLLRKFSCFHAKDIFSGGGIFARTKYPQEVRWKLLRLICEIPSKFDLPIVMGFVDRAEYNAVPFRSSWKKKQLDAGAQALASIACAIAVEKYLIETNANEVAAFVFENNDTARELIRNNQRMLKDSSVKTILGDSLGPRFSAYLPLSRIVEAPLFSEKNESSILQVADAMAWAINRKLRNAIECDRFFEPIDKHLIIRAKAFGPAPVVRVARSQT